MQNEVEKRIKVKSNYFQFNCNTTIFKYKVVTVPQVPLTQVGLLNKILSKLADKLFNILNPYQPINFTIYSPTQSDGATLTTIHENINYTINLIPSGILEVSEKERESLAFMGRFFKILQSNLKLKQVGRKYFDDKIPEDFQQWKLTVWPGFQTSLNQYKNHILLNVDSCFKVLRQTTMYEHIKELMVRFRGNQERIKEETIGMIVMTR